MCRLFVWIFLVLCAQFGSNLTEHNRESFEYDKAGFLGYLPPLLKPGGNTIDVKVVPWYNSSPNPPVTTDPPIVPTTHPPISSISTTEGCSRCPTILPQTKTNTVTVTKTTTKMLIGPSSVLSNTVEVTLPASHCPTTLPPTATPTPPIQACIHHQPTCVNEKVPNVITTTLTSICQRSLDVKIITETVASQTCLRETVTETKFVPTRVPISVEFDINTELCKIASVRHVIRKITTTDHDRNVTRIFKKADSIVPDSKPGQDRSTISIENTEQTGSVYESSSTEKVYDSSPSYHEKKDKESSLGYGRGMIEGFSSGYGGQLSVNKSMEYSGGRNKGVISSYGGQTSGFKNLGYGAGRGGDISSGYGGQLSVNKSIEYSGGRSEGVISSYGGQTSGFKRLGYGGRRGGDISSGYGGQLSVNKSMEYSGGRNEGVISSYGGQTSGFKSLGYGAGRGGDFSSGYGGQISGYKNLGYGGGRSEDVSSGYGGQISGYNNKEHIKEKNNI